MHNPQKDDSTFEAFNRDVAANSGYLYTTNARLSSRLANRRLTDAALQAVSFEGKRIIDVGCGDGAYTAELFDRGHPLSMFGFDPAREAIDIARQHAEARAITYEVNSAYEISKPDDSFDIAHIRGVLHHVERPAEVLREAFRVAPTLVVIEPNGYNPVLKLLERYSSYHREHGEKSYTARDLDRWISSMGGRIVWRRWLGLVPFFCPDGFARVMKFVEPAVERVPAMNALSCAVYVFVAVRE